MILSLTLQVVVTKFCTLAPRQLCCHECRRLDFKALSFVTVTPVDSPHNVAECGTLMFLLDMSPELAVEQAVDMSVIWDAMTLIWCLCNAIRRRHCPVIIEAQWRIYASTIWDIIGSENGKSPEPMLAYFQLDPWENKLQLNLNRNTHFFFQEN